MSSSRAVYFLEFSPDNGKRWFKLTNMYGLQVWMSKRGPSAKLDDWRGQVRMSSKLITFPVLPPIFDKGVAGVEAPIPESDIDWKVDRLKIEIRFSLTPSQYGTVVIANGHTYQMMRPVVSGEKKWKIIADIIDWYRTTLEMIEPRGEYARDCTVVAHGSLAKPATSKLIGPEYMLFRTLNGWMATTGGSDC